MILAHHTEEARQEAVRRRTRSRPWPGPAPARLLLDRNLAVPTRRGADRRASCMSSCATGPASSRCSRQDRRRVGELDQRAPGAEGQRRRARCRAQPRATTYPADPVRGGARRRLLHRQPVRGEVRGQGGLGGKDTIRERIGVLSTQGYIKFFRNAGDYGLPSQVDQRLSLRRRHGPRHPQEMSIRPPARSSRPPRVLPSHFQVPAPGAASRSRTPKCGC